MIRRKGVFSLVGALLLVLALNGPLTAQFTTASLNGIVVDPSGAAVPGAKVSVANTGTGFESTATSAETGLYVFPRLPVGSYTLRVEKEGFSTYVQEGIVLTVNQSATQNVSLRVGEKSESVMVNSGCRPCYHRDGNCRSTGRCETCCRFAAQWQEGPVPSLSWAGNCRCGPDPQPGLWWDVSRRATG